MNRSIFAFVMFAALPLSACNGDDQDNNGPPLDGQQHVQRCGGYHQPGCDVDNPDAAVANEGTDPDVANAQDDPA
jgi:hypothetical protein